MGNVSENTEQEKFGMRKCTRRLPWPVMSMASSSPGLMQGACALEQLVSLMYHFERWEGCILRRACKAGSKVEN